MAFIINEGGTGKLRFTLKDDADPPATVSAITAATLTYYDERTGNVINSRDEQDVNATNNCTFSSGLFTWSVQAADTVLLDKSRGEETHIALFTITYSGGVLVKNFTIKVRNIRKKNQA